jgi:hypothetical protein
LIVWAIGAVPALGLASLVAAKPRLPRVIAGFAIFQVLVMLAAYVIALAVAGFGD